LSLNPLAVYIIYGIEIYIDYERYHCNKFSF